MIISASRRTDIPACYPEWFTNRLAEGFALVRNPFNKGLLHKVTLTKEAVDCIVFITKNPAPMFPYLDRLERYDYYFHFTLNPYGHELEPGLPGKSELLDSFKALSDRLGPHRIIWRYDPVITDKHRDSAFHLNRFSRLARALSGYTESCMVGFLEPYAKTRRNMNGEFAEMATEQRVEFLKQMSAEGKENGIELRGCSGQGYTALGGIKEGRCIDPDLISRIKGRPFRGAKDKNQRDRCNCIESVDIGEYDSCTNECSYCYANNNRKVAMEKFAAHDPASPSIGGWPGPGDTIKERKVKACKDMLLDI